MKSKPKEKDTDNSIYDDEINEAFMKTKKDTTTPSSGTRHHDKVSNKPKQQYNEDNNDSESSRHKHMQQNRPQHNVKLLIEKDLKSYIVDRISDIEEGLQVHSQDLETEVGKIDILAVDKNSNFVVLELNTGTTNETSISTISACMSWIKDNSELNPDSKGVRGFLIAKEFDQRTIASSRVIPSLELRMYKPYLEFHTV